MVTDCLLPPIVMEREYRDAVVSSVIAIIVCGGGKIVYATSNAETLFGCQCARQLDGLSIDSLVSSMSLNEYEKIRDEFRAGKSPQLGGNKSVMVKRLDGSEFEVTVGLTPVMIKGVQHIVCRFIQ